MMKIYAVHYNKPEYIRLQKRSFDKWIEFNFEFIVVNNSIDPQIKNMIENESRALGLRTIDSKNMIEGLPLLSHSQSFKYILEDLAEGESAMLLDHDIFLFNPLTREYYEGYDLVFLPQIRDKVEYPWPGCIIFNGIKKNESLSINPGYIENENCDTGGEMYYYLRDMELNVKRIKNHADFKFPNFVCENLDNIFLHMVAGSGWDRKNNLDEKLKFVLEKTMLNE